MVINGTSASKQSVGKWDHGNNDPSVFPIHPFRLPQVRLWHPEESWGFPFSFPSGITGKTPISSGLGFCLDASSTENPGGIGSSWDFSFACCSSPLVAGWEFLVLFYPCPKIFWVCGIVPHLPFPYPSFPACWWNFLNFPILGNVYTALELGSFLWTSPLPFPVKKGTKIH